MPNTAPLNNQSQIINATGDTSTIPDTNPTDPIIISDVINEPVPAMITKIDNNDPIPSSITQSNDFEDPRQLPENQINSATSNTDTKHKTNQPIQTPIASDIKQTTSESTSIQPKSTTQNQPPQTTNTPDVPEQSTDKNSPQQTKPTNQTDSAAKQPQIDNNDHPNNTNPTPDLNKPKKTTQDNNLNQKKDILQILQKNNKLTEEQVKDIRLQQLNTGKDIETLLTNNKSVNSTDLTKAKAELFDIPYIQANELTVSPEAIQLIPRSVAQKFTVLPFNLNQQTNELSVAMAEPTDLQVIGFLEQKTSSKITPYAASKEDLIPIIEDRYGATISSEVKQVIKDTAIGQTAKIAPEKGVIQQAPIAKIVSYILSYAVNTRSSDIHIEPEEGRTRVRYRIDGILYEKLVLPRGVHDALVSKIKIMGKMKIDERRIPQDGRFNFTGENQEIDLRVSTLPTVHGEKVVMRLLKKSGGAKSLSDLGLRGKALKNLEEAVLRPHGIILVCGPTGSGKTTTLYSVISKINTTKVNIMTLEDPVEYQMKGVNQVQINPQAGLTFASGLRSFLRQDPNVIMVGEIRDSETAGLAIQASLTGHLVFSTLHTNNSAGSLPRLLDMGAEPFLLSSTINAVVAQRVVRVICNNCKVMYPASDEVIKDMKQVLGKIYPQEHNNSLQKGKGCSECNNTGYQGRVGIFEVLPMTEAITKLIMERSPASELEQKAIDDGMLTMKQDGYLKVLDGTTTMEEVLRVAQD